MLQEMTEGIGIGDLHSKVVFQGETAAERAGVGRDRR